MMFYWLMIPISVWLLIEVRHLLRLRKHDRVLFPICVVRGDLMAFLQRHFDADTLTREDYIYARLMLSTLDHTVRLYREHRTRFFNLRAFVRFLRQFEASAKELNEVRRTDNPELRAIESRISRAMVRGFFTYTPFLKSEFAVHILFAIMGFLARLGLKFVGKRLEQMREFVAFVKTQAQIAGDTGSYQAA